MVALAMGITWFGYAAGLYGYCLTKQYDVQFTQLIYPTGQMSWPPGKVANGVDSQTPQPTITEQYVPGLDAIPAALGSIASALGALIGGAADAAGSVAGAVGGVAGSVLGAVTGGGSSSSTSKAATSSSSTTKTPAAQPTFPPRVTGSVGTPSTSAGQWGVSDLSGGGQWGVSDLSGGR